MTVFAVPHHRHATTNLPLQADESLEAGEASPLVVATGADKPYQEQVVKKKKKKKKKVVHTHLSLMEDDEQESTSWKQYLQNVKHDDAIRVLVFMLLVVSAILCVLLAGRNSNNSSNYIPVEQAKEHWLPMDKNLTLWFRTWGRAVGGIPVLFIHGGPGNAIADYFGNGNKRFFGNAEHNFFVVEIDQRGTGKSQPSVRDGWENMKYYHDITIDKMCHDFELVRTHLGIDQWLVWGGSFGSTLAINYGERYPDSSLALILRGLYLDTSEEVSAVYSQTTYQDNPKRLKEFKILYDYAAQYVRHTKQEQQQLDPNDAERLLRVYAEMITSGDHHAIWHWFVFENNLMELDPQNILDPNRIDHTVFPEALSVAFFETRLWIHGSFEAPVTNLLEKDKLKQLSMPLWVCQGQRDEVCPPQYGRRFVDAVEAAGQSPRVVSRFLNATHEDTDPVLEECLKRSLQEFVDISSES